MKDLLNKTFLLILLFVTFLSSNVYANENKWNLEIELDKQNYIFHEPIWLDITLTNITTDTLRTDGLVQPNHRQFFIEIIDEAEKLVEYTGGQYSIMASLPGELLIDAGEQDYGTFDLLRMFSSYNKGSGYRIPIYWFTFIPEGTYTVRVLFEDDISNKLNFNIVKPSGDEKEALELIEKASKIWKDDTDHTSQIYKEIVERFPNSVFAEMCFYLSRVYSQERKDGLKQGSYDRRIFKREMIENYPNSGRSKGWLDAITHDMGDDVINDAEKWEIINKYLRDYPNTRCYKFAKQMQERIFGIENNWGLEIELEKQVYISHEPIWIDVTITNITSDTLRTHGLVEANFGGFVKKTHSTFG